MAFNMLLLLVAAAICTPGLARPGMVVPPDASPYGNIFLGNNNEQTISDAIIKTNKNSLKVLTQGDIEDKPGRSSKICKRCQWDKTKQGLVNVPYVISEEYSADDISLIQSTFVEFSTMTCVMFKERTSEADYIKILDEYSCSSYIGRIGGEQTLSLARIGCMSYGLIQHELMHALGIYHEHTRSDRDNYVRIVWQFIAPENDEDFNKDTGDTMNIPYDYKSIMHYGSTTFSNTPGQKTIIPIPDPNVPIGQQNGFSALDVKKINLLYSCNLCRTKLLGPSGDFSSADTASQNKTDNCLWLLQVPSGQVVLQFNRFVCSSSKCKAKIKVYDGITKSSTLLATFSSNQPNTILVSSRTFMLVELIDDPSFTSSFSASYNTTRYGGTFTANTGTLFSPRYPSNFPINTRAIYVIIGPPGKKVMLKTSSTGTLSSLRCLNENLVIRDGGNLLSSALSLVCGVTGNVAVTSTGSTVVIVFSSNNSLIRTGFKIDYSFVS